jgi:integral membrane sensor domain MASE1
MLEVEVHIATAITFIPAIVGAVCGFAGGVIGKSVSSEMQDTFIGYAVGSCIGALVGGAVVWTCVARYLTKIKSNNSRVVLANQSA